MVSTLLWGEPPFYSCQKFHIKSFSHVRVANLCRSRWWEFWSEGFYIHTFWISVLFVIHLMCHGLKGDWSMTHVQDVFQSWWYCVLIRGGLILWNSSIWHARHGADSRQDGVSGAVWNAYRASSSHLIAYGSNPRQCVPQGTLTKPKPICIKTHGARPHHMSTGLGNVRAPRHLHVSAGQSFPWSSLELSAFTEK